MDIKNIRLNIIQVAVIVVQTITVVWLYAGQAGKLDGVFDTTARIERKQDKESDDNKMWKSKIEADLADLKVRTALMEARLNLLNNEK